MRARELSCERRTIFSAGPCTYRVIHQASSPPFFLYSNFNFWNIQVYLKKAIFFDTNLDFSYTIRSVYWDNTNLGFSKEYLPIYTVHF